MEHFYPPDHDETEPRPVPVQEHYVRLLLLASSCFGTDRDGYPNICASEPCACAQSLLDEIGKPLKIEIEQLRAALDESVKLQSHYARLLNGYDGGRRMEFADREAWLGRLASLRDET